MKGRYYYDQMPLHLKSLWITEVEKTGRDINVVLKDWNFKDFENFIKDSFIWEDTKQGHNFWLDVSKQNLKTLSKDALQDVDVDNLIKIIKASGKTSYVLSQLKSESVKAKMFEYLAYFLIGLVFTLILCR
jgi:hypothetical protein